MKSFNFLLNFMNYTDYAFKNDREISLDKDVTI